MDESKIPATPAQGATRLVRLALIGLALALLVGAFAYVGGWFTPRALTADAIVNRFEQISGGPHPGFRRNHAKGVCVTGYFDSSGNGVELSKAAVFPQGRVPVLGRFAFAGGNPYVPDSPQLVRSLALLFQLSNGEEWRTAMINIPVFPVNTPEAFYEQLQAGAPVPATGKPDPEKMKAFLDRHPETAKALPLIRANPVSSGFDNTPYNSLNTFLFTNATGATVPVRWSFLPLQPFQPAPPADTAAPADKNALFDALISAVHAQPLHWRLVLTVGEPGDPIDPTIPWPPERRQVDAGTLTIDQIASEDTSPIRDINFDPLVLPAGITGSSDPLLSTRSAAYSESFTRREGERKSPSEVSPQEVAK